ncbi:MAG: amylo-alpha-1,6-glucosidase [Myxococcales bacterium]|nr:amylo-alpha-1,6-glucosidase [Myxococcales bacterium]MDH3843627.1 amylo-alpha-1,6-glucosidase [Myxococcales bacterium]
MILPSWFPSRSDSPAGLRLLTRASSDAADEMPVLQAGPDAEWLCTNAGGSFAMGTIDRRPRRKYHSLLTVREPGIGGPLNIAAELEEWFEVGGETFALHSYDWGNAVEPNGVQYLVEFDPQPRWTYRFAGLDVIRELWLEDGTDAVWLRYSIEGLTEPVQLRLRPLIRCRPIHKLTFANPFLNGEVDVDDRSFLQATLRPYKDVPPLVVSLHGAQGTFGRDGHWYEGVHYEWENTRGYDDAEDLFTPGEFCITLDGDTSLSMRLGTTPTESPEPQVLVSLSREGRSFLEELDDAADAYLVKLHGNRTGVIAGFPWFGEWSRDSLISLPGLCLARDKVDDALAILESLAERLEGGLIPNIPKSGDVPANKNAIDASLLFIRATALTSRRTRSRRVVALQEACLDLIECIIAGADARVHLDRQGFLFVDQGPWALTWMDAIVDQRPVTPRWGYAVDLNALWLSSLITAGRWAKKLRPKLGKTLEETAKKLSDHFEEKFWLQDLGFLTDTHDGRNPDRKLRPNQLWALVLPGVPLDKSYKRRALHAVRTKLLTPVGLRTLSPDDPDYRPVYEGGQADRDLAYHQGTVWPWLLGLYADAVRAIDGPKSVNAELLPVLASLCAHFRTEGCIGQIGEVFDGDPPHRPGGAPAQAWSVAEVLRIAKTAVP